VTSGAVRPIVAARPEEGAVSGSRRRPVAGRPPRRPWAAASESRWFDATRPRAIWIRCPRGTGSSSRPGRRPCGWA